MSMKSPSFGRSLPGFVFVYFLAVLALFTGTIAFSVASTAKKQVETRVADIRKTYIDAQKETVKAEVERIDMRIRELRFRGFDKSKADLYERLFIASAVLASRAGGGLKEKLTSLSYSPRGLYYWAFDRSGSFLFDGSGRSTLFPSAASLSSGNSELAHFFGELFKTGKAFGSYALNEGNRLIAGIRDEKNDLFLCALIPESVMDEYIQAQIVSVLEHERFGADGYGYFFVIDQNGLMIQHAVDQSLVGRALSDIVSPDGVNIGALFTSALADRDGSFVSYSWFAPNKTGAEQKTSYLLRVRPWNWIIGAGFYISDFESHIKKESAAVASAVTASMRAQFFVLALAALGTILLGTYLTLRVVRLEKEEARHYNELSRYKLLLDESALVSRTDPQGTITYVNDLFCAVTGYSRDQVIGKSHNIERHPSTPKELFQELWQTIGAGKSWTGIMKNRRADGSSYFKKATILPICDDGGRPIEYISAGQDITELVEQRAKLERVFHTDPLTGLGSRIKLLEDIDRSNNPSVALLDLIDFGRINDGYGEEAGDTVLTECAARLGAAPESHEYSLYRIYADTFAVFGDAPDSFAFIKHLKALRESVIAKPFLAGKDTVPLDLRIGVASGDKDVLAYADLALGAARDRNIELYSYGSGEEELSLVLTKSIDALKGIHGALRANRVYPVFQPIACAKTGDIAKFECLMRAMDETGAEMQPGDFIPVSKKTRIYPALSRSIIEKSIRAFNGTNYEFSVNLTLEDLFNSSTIDLLLVTAKDAELAERMVVEIVETEELVAYDEALKALRRLKAEGIKLAIDDFGTGYSNFTYLLKVDPDYVKLDGSIISRIVSDARAEGLARSIVAFARDSGIQTVAEYVSSKEIADAAASLGIDYLQGFWIGKPRASLR